MNLEKCVRVIDKTESLIDIIFEHLESENCDHCKKLVKESFDKWK
jgi:hypothetical protein